MLNLSGPEVAVRATKVLPLSLIFHELATNAFKYGVLGALPGQLRVEWTLTDEHVELTWIEDYDSPQEFAEASEGFGSTLLEGAAAQLDAELTVDQQPERRVTRFRF
jgi:two-component system CheB/CheR fusion protein